MERNAAVVARRGPRTGNLPVVKSLPLAVGVVRRLVFGAGAAAHADDDDDGNDRALDEEENGAGLPESVE